MLAQLYRETKVSLANLRPNDVALGVFARALEARCGASYDVDEIRQQLERLAVDKHLPKLPNDVPFTPRNHVTSEGKRYRRKTMRCKARRTAGSDPGPLWRDAM